MLILADPRFLESWYHWLAAKKTNLAAVAGDLLDGTWFFNPGHPMLTRALKSKIPDHLMLDLSACTATRHATPNVGRAGIIKPSPLT